MNAEMSGVYPIFHYIVGLRIVEIIGFVVAVVLKKQLLDDCYSVLYSMEYITSAHQTLFSLPL